MRKRERPEAENSPEAGISSQRIDSLVQEMIRARRAKGLSQKGLEQLSGVRQPVIARLEVGSSDPRLTTLVRILRALGKKLVIEDA